VKCTLLVLSFIISISFLNQTFAEVYTTGSAADNSNNIIVIGYCLGNVRIAGDEYTITTPSAFILKLNSDGEKIWVKFINSTQSIKANAIAVDSAGNIYITGEFSGTANFGPNSLSAQNADAFIVKLNIDGDVEWVKQGVSVNNTTGNDIFVKGNFVYVCGDGKPITFDSLSIVGGGFTVIYSLNGNAVNLFQVGDKAYKLVLDNNADIILYNGAYDSMWNSYWSLLSKYSNSGNFIWTSSNWIEHNQSFYTDSNNNIYNVAGFPNNGISLRKFDSSGNKLLYKNFGPNNSSHSGKDIIFKNNTSLFCGYYSSGFQFGNSTLQSNGLTDFFIGAVDTNLEPVWIKHGGGSYDDELNSLTQLDEGTIICSGNFKGTISVDSLVITGGNSADAKWGGIAKYDSVGNLIWLKNVVEQLSPPSLLNWFPLEVGNKFLYYGNKHDYYDEYFIQVLSITDSIWFNNKKYFIINGFGTGNLVFRFDVETQKIMTLYQDLEYTFMDFSRYSGETFQQIQSDGKFKNTTVVSKNIYILGDTLVAKGYYNTLVFGGPPNPYVTVYIWRYFAPGIGWILQDEECGNASSTDLVLVEYLTYKDGLSSHKKHQESATLNFQPITFISQGDSLYEDFTITHPYSKQFIPPNRGFFSYMLGEIQSFYSNDIDTLWNNTLIINQNNATDFVLNYSIDTIKYNLGYKLFYRIVTYDKAIIRDSIFVPQTGYYKLFWKDSATSVTQTEFEALTYSLSQNYPNPFNPVSKIVFTIPKRENVSLKVYDILGSEIATLVNSELEAGKYEVEFSGNDLSSGVYIYQIRAEAFRETKKMILMR
jgi:hypothetical protein